jgi:hypothetical protein
MAGLQLVCTRMVLLQLQGVGMSCKGVEWLWQRLARTCNPITPPVHTLHETQRL